MPVSHQRTRSLTLGALISWYIHVDAHSDVPTSGPLDASRIATADGDPSFVTSQKNETILLIGGTPELMFSLDRNLGLIGGMTCVVCSCSW